MYSIVCGLTCIHNYSSPHELSAFTYFDTKKMAEFLSSTLGSALLTFSFSSVGFYHLWYWWASHNALVLCIQSQKNAVGIQWCLYKLKWKQIPWWHTNPDNVWIYFYVSILWITNFFCFHLILICFATGLCFFFYATIICELAQ